MTSLNVGQILANNSTSAAGSLESRTREPAINHSTFGVTVTSSEDTEVSPDQTPIKVEVATRYLEADSDPEDERFVFAYTITITNQGDTPARLLTRHWIITHGNGKTQEVKGEGVVGEQPLIKPGQGYQYTSGTILETPMGSMGGSYQMVDDNGREFNAEIPDFTLSSPNTLH